MDHLEKFPVTRIGRVCDFTASGQRYQVHRNDGECRQPSSPQPGWRRKETKARVQKELARRRLELTLHGLTLCKLQGKGPVQALQPGQARRW